MKSLFEEMGGTYTLGADAIMFIRIWNFRRKNRITESTAECVCAI